MEKKTQCEKSQTNIKDDEVIIKPVGTKKLSDFFDTLEIDLEAPITDWKKTKAELLTGGEK